MSWRRRKVVVTGGAGFLGSHLCEALVALACDVVGWRAPVEVQPGRVRPDQSEVQELLSDNANAKRLLSWKPTVSLEDGLTATADWVREHLDRYKVDRYMV